MRKLLLLLALLVLATAIFLLWPPRDDPGAPCYPDCGSTVVTTSS